MNSAPNILLITDDQHRWDFYDNRTVPDLSVPAIRRLSAEGATLVNAASSCPICMPTRFSWLYGLYASQAAHQLMHNSHDWPTHLPSMAHSLQNRGYRTVLTGKLHSVAGLFNMDLADIEDVTRQRGFDDVVEVSGKSLSYWYDCAYTDHLRGKGLLEKYRADVKTRCSQLGGREHFSPSPLSPEDHMDGFIGARALERLRECARHKPFFMHASFCGPHFPLDPPEPYFSRYRPEDMPPPEGVDDAAEIKRFREERALYCGLIHFVDEQIGALLDELDNLGIAENTLVVFTTDHGDMMGHHSLTGKGRWYDTSCRTPVIARFPGVIPSGTVLDSPAESVDLPCTLLDAAGCAGEDVAISDLLPNSPGLSYWKYLQGDTNGHREWSYSEHVQPDWRMCRDRTWKYVFRPEDEDLLYNLEDDPWESNNLVCHDGCREKLVEMKDRLLQSMSRCVAPNTKML